MNMLIYDQVAQRTSDIAAQIELFASFGLQQWIRDTVDAVHIYLDPEFQTTVPSLVGQFKAHLAFNYEIIPGVEFELLELVEGYSYQVMDPGRMSHFGYHLKRDQIPQLSTADVDTVTDSLLEELQRLRVIGLKTMQVSQTIAHAGTNRRYRYAYVTGHLTGGIPIKIIQRLLPMGARDVDASLQQGRELFECLTT